MWGAILAAAAIVIAHDLLQQHGAVPFLAGPAPTVTAAPSAPVSPAGPAPHNRTVRPSPGATPVRHTAAPPRSQPVDAVSSVRPARTRPTSTGATGPPPSQSPPSAPVPLTAASLSVAVPARSPLLTLKAALSTPVPGAPPFPVGVNAVLVVDGLKATVVLP